jgi:hypothetical protein
VTQAAWTPDALEELLAPIALYPDQLLGQILAASGSSQEVLDAGTWLLDNQNLKGNELDAAAQKAGFGPAMRALLPYPSVIDMMCQEIDWTRQLGSAFNSDQKSVLAAVQRLREEAADVGNLKTTPQQTVVNKSEGGNVYIEVKPADPTIVYVPQYDPQTVYTTPPPAAPAKEEKEGVSTGAAVAGALIAFGVGVAVGNAVDDDYYYPNWGYGSVYFGPRPFYPPAYVYRPVYGPAFRPAYGYTSPPGYRYNYNNVRVQNNIVINTNNNYYNRFNNNQNLRTGGTRSPLANSQRNVGQTAAKRNAGQTRTGQTASRDVRPGSSASASPKAGQASRPAANARQTQPSDRATARKTNAAPHADRGYGNSTRPATATQPRPSQTPENRAAPKHDSAFSGAQTKGSGNFQRAASARGNASMGSRPTPRKH